METFVKKLPVVGEGFPASRGPFDISGLLEEELKEIVLRLPFWTAKETLKLFTELYLTAASGQTVKTMTKSELLEKLIERHSPYEDFEVLKEAKDDSRLQHWAVVPKSDTAQTLDELMVALDFSRESQKSIVFTYDSKKADVPIVLAGQVHKLREDGFTLKSDWKYRSYLFENIARLSVVEGRHALHGVPTLHLRDGKPEDESRLTVELGKMIPWYKL